MHIIIVAVFILFSTASTAISAIIFTNGKWETTFNCAEWKQGSGLVCDGVETSGGWYPAKVTGISIASGGTGYIIGDILTTTGWSGQECKVRVDSIGGSGEVTSVSVTQIGFGSALDLSLVTPYNTTGGSGSAATLMITSFSTEKDQITGDANYSGGKGDKGFRHWKGDGQNVNGGGVEIVFPAAQKELWIRWYMRYEQGFSWSSLVYDKILYIHTGVLGTDTAFIHYGLNEMVPSAQGTSDPYQVRTGSVGWEQTQGGSVGDGLFHAYELHLKMDTDGTNGIGRVWIDGILRAENTHVNFSNASATARLGWPNILVGSNQATPNNSKCSYVDYDDMIVYNTTPPSVDAEGNPFIGPISFSTPVDGVCGSADGESFSEAPTTNLCTAGTDGTVSGDGPWTWACNGTNGGSNASCSATLLSNVITWFTSGEPNVVITDPATGNAIGPPQ